MRAKLEAASPGSRSPGRPPDLFCPGLTRGLGWHARGSRAPVARMPHRRRRVPARGAARSALPRMRARRLHATQHATTRCFFNNIYDCVLERDG